MWVLEYSFLQVGFICAYSTIYTYTCWKLLQKETDENILKNKSLNEIYREFLFVHATVPSGILIQTP